MTVDYPSIFSMEIHCSKVFCVIFLWFCFVSEVFSSFKDVTDSVGLEGSDLGVLAAVGDFNADKEPDLFYINNSKDTSQVNVYLWDSKGEEVKKSLEATIELKKAQITNVIPGDFNGDGHLDALVSFYDTTNQDFRERTFVNIFLGKDSQFELDKVIKLSDTFKDQPAIVDFDGDLQPDLLAEKTADGKRYWWKYDEKTNSFASNLIESKGKMFPLSRPHSCAFLDVNGDYTPDMVLTTTDASSQSKPIYYEVWLNKDGNFTTSNEEIYPQPPDVVVVGQSTFADIDSDGIADHLLPVCSDLFCKKSEIYVYSRIKKQWSSILLSENSKDYKWKFINDKTDNTLIDDIPLMTIRIGDYDMDGYPDAAVVLLVSKNKGVEKRRVALLENVKCGGGSTCYNGRTFKLDLSNHALNTIHDPVIVGFFDLFDNGILDVLVVSANDTSKTYQTHVIQTNIYSDTCFLKVMVLGGSCYSDCSSGVTPYGVNQAGPFIKYVTTGLNGDTKQASATQLSQAAYFALQPPYVVFGLGRTPNFVEKVIIGLPRSKNSPDRVRTWTSIIPNSQVIIIPYPPDDPGAWKSKLLVTPSKLVLLTGGALLATCVFIGALVAVLHWKEKKEDLKEKQEAAHKFHFDAM